MTFLPIDIYRHIYGFLVCYDPLIHTPEFIGSHGNVDGAKWIIKHDKWNPTDMGTALYYAIDNGHVDLVEYFVSIGIDIDDLNESLLIASSKGYLDLVQYLHQRGGKLDWHFIHPLRMAATNGHLNVVKYIIDNGIPDRGGVAISDAIRGGYLEIVKYLYERDKYIDNRWGVLACAFGHLEILRFLHQMGFKLDYSFNRSLRLASEEGYFDIVMYLFENGINPSLIQLADASFRAYRRGHQELSKFLERKFSE